MIINFMGVIIQDDINKITSSYRQSIHSSTFLGEMTIKLSR